MSYCRFSDGDVYAYECEGGVQFWVISKYKDLDRLCNTFGEAYEYAKCLRDEHGLNVPDYAIEELRVDAAEEARRDIRRVMRHSTPEEQADYEAMLERMSEPLYTAEELESLKSENAKLRDMVAHLWMCSAWETDMEGRCDECDRNDDENGGCKVYKEMQDLGIEVRWW